MIQLLGFSPDADSTIPGVITDCVDFIPYKNGMQAAPTNTTPTEVPVLAAECIGATVVYKLDDTKRILAGTTTKLYELVSGTWTDYTHAAGNYTGGSDTRWSFTQFGDATLAANRTEILQRSTSGQFADITGSPKAEVIFSVGSFVMALNVNDGAEKPDGWHCSAAFDDTSWSPSVTTQAASGRLVSSPGRLTAGLRLGDYAIAYKQKSIYLGQYVGAPVVWDWILIPGGEAGCIGKEAVCDLGGMHFFVGNDNFWLFDGTRPVPIGNDHIRQWFYDNSSVVYRYRTKCFFDRQQNRVWVFFPGLSSTGMCDKVLVYHVLAKRWGRADRSVEAVLNYAAAGITYDTLNTLGATYDALPNISYDSQYWISGGQALSVVNTSHQLQLVVGSAGSSSFTTGDAGDDSVVSTLTGVRLRFASGSSPTSASMTAYHKSNQGDSDTTGSTVNISDGKFDVLQEDRWHKAVFTFTGDTKVNGINPDLVPGGDV